MARVIGLLVVLLSMWRADSSRADTLEGVLHVSGSTAHVLRWTLVRDADAVAWRSWYRTTSGAIDAEDELRWDGDLLGSYRYTRTPIGEIASVVRAGDSLIHRQTRAGVLRQRREPFHPDVLAGPMQSRSPSATGSGWRAASAFASGTPSSISCGRSPSASNGILRIRRRARAARSCAWLRTAPSCGWLSRRCSSCSHPMARAFVLSSDGCCRWPWKAETSAPSTASSSSRR